MNRLTKPFRLTIRDGIANADWRDEQTGETLVSDVVQAHETDTLAELEAIVRTLGGVVLDAGQANALPTPSAPSLEDYEHAVEDMLQSCAAAHRYDDIVSACSYAAVANPFQEESAVILAWRGNVWAWCYGLLSDPPATLPTLAEFRASLLAAWPMP